jgi:enoyl-CoA hydratase
VSLTPIADTAGVDDSLSPIVGNMVDYEVTGNVALITINRPEARNAVNADVAAGIESAIDKMEADDTVWVGILTGNGPVFCAGADLKAVSSGQAGAISTTRGGFGGIVTRARTKPIIAACNGPALAGGTEIAISCDLIVAASNASFGIPEVKRSLIAAAGGLFRLPRVLPRNIAMELALTGDPISAERAYHFGLVNQLCEPGTAVETARVLAARITVNAPLAVRASRNVVLGSASMTEAEAWELSGREAGPVFRSEDFTEGPRAFIEKRPPVWKGR